MIIISCDVTVGEIINEGTGAGIGVITSSVVSSTGTGVGVSDGS